MDANVSTDMSRSVTQSVDRLQNMLNTQGRVDFVFHCWKEFTNLGTDGLVFKAINAAHIPRMSLIPIVATPHELGIHRIDEDSNRVVPSSFSYLREANWTVVDLLSRFASHSMVHVAGFDYNVTEINRAFSIFESVLAGLPAMYNLEHLAQYCGVELPYPVPKTDIPSLADVEATILRSNRLASEETLKLSALVSAIRQSVAVSVSMAVEPVNGRLPSAVRLINEGHKFRFDDTESWLEKQFPNFDTTSKINIGSKGNSQQDAITQLATIIAEALKKNSSDGEIDMRRFTDALPENLRGENWDELPEDVKQSLTQDYLNSLNNTTIQTEDVLGMTAAELNRVDTMTNDAIVTTDGVITEDQARAQMTGKDDPEVTDYQKSEQEAREFDTKGKPVNEAPEGEARGQEASGVDPVNALREDLSAPLGGSDPIEAQRKADVAQADADAVKKRASEQEKKSQDAKPSSTAAGGGEVKDKTATSAESGAAKTASGTRKGESDAKKSKSK